MTKHGSLFPFLFLLAARVCSATELHVSATAPVAADTNPGTPEKPLRTISAAVAKVAPGDRVIVHGGDYREFVPVTVSGAPGKPVTIEAAPGETPVIKGSEIITGWTKEEGVVWKAKLPDVKKDHPLPQTDHAFWNIRDVRQVFAKDGVMFDAVPLHRVTARAEMAAGTFFCDAKAGTLFIRLVDGSSPEKLRIEASMRAGWMEVSGSHLVIRGLQFRHASTMAITPWPATFYRGSFNTMEDCAITWGDFCGISISGSNNTLRRCIVACNGDSGMGGTGTGHLMEGCRVLYNNLDRYSTGWHAGGAKYIPQFKNSRIIGNEFAHNIGPGLWLDGGCDENVIERNVCHDNEGPGIMVEVSRGNLVANNLLFDNRNQRAGMFLQRDEELFEKEKKQAFNPADEPGLQVSELIYHAGIGRGIYISSSPETKVFDNTSYGNEGEGICVEGEVRQAAEPMSTRDCRIFNNISAFNHGSQLTVRRNGLDAETHGNESDYNLLIAQGAVLVKTGWGGVSVIALRDWRRISGGDAHSVEADPRFAMIAADDFRLQPKSPALDVGKKLDEVKTDLTGAPRNRKEGVSIGAYEGPALDMPQPWEKWLNLPPLPR